MKITIRTLLGNSFELDVDQSDTTEDIKRKIEKHTETPFDQQRLLLSNKKRMEEGATIESSGIIDGDHLVLFIRLPNRRSIIIDHRSDSYNQLITSIEKESINQNSNIETSITNEKNDNINDIGNYNNNNNNNNNNNSDNTNNNRDNKKKEEEEENNKEEEEEEENNIVNNEHENKSELRNSNSHPVKKKIKNKKSDQKYKKNIKSKKECTIQ
ncbi:hypothetical protein ACTA71_004446 [Dictyostelium dimigraforme]